MPLLLKQLSRWHFNHSQYQVLLDTEPTSTQTTPRHTTMGFPTSKPRSQITRGGPATGLIFIRDQLEITTWLLLGAVAQTALALLPIKPVYKFSPAITILLWRFSHALLMSYGFLENLYMKDVTMGKTTAMLPSNADPSSDPADSDICVFLLTTRCNQ